MSDCKKTQGNFNFGSVMILISLLCAIGIRLGSGADPPRPGGGQRVNPSRRSGRHCHKLELSFGNEQPIFYELNPAIDGRFFVAFTINTEKVLNLI